MKIFLVLSSFPYADGEAIEVVAHEVVRLMAQKGHALDVQVLIRDPQSELHDQRGQWAQTHMAGPLVRFLKPLYLQDYMTKPYRWSRLFGAVWDLLWSLPLLRRRINRRLFPAAVLGPEIRRRVQENRPDVILSIWSWEALAATYDIPGVCKFVYYGNPDHKPAQARFNSPALFNLSGRGLLQRFNLGKQRLLTKALGLQHVRMMNQCDVTANNSLVDADFYKKNGHPASIYLQNMWPQARMVPTFTNTSSSARPVKIVASVGNIGATGNTFGLYYLGHEIAPRLEERMGKDALTLDVFGGGTAYSLVRRGLEHPLIRLRGWVNDIEREILESTSFLVLTNVSGFIVGNTRILLAWSLGACVIAHKNSALSMPEIMHRENALLGESAGDIAGWIQKTAHDSDLRQRIGRGGYDTYQKYFRSDIVVPSMLQSMEHLLSQKNRGRNA